MGYPYTKDFQIHHKDAYEQFYCSYDLVLSTQHIFIFGNHLGKGLSDMDVKQKLPHQLYLGINFTNSPYCLLDFVSALDYEKNAFMTTTPHEYLDDGGSIATACTNVLQSIQAGRGMQMGVLTEYPKGRGTSVSQMIFCLFVTALFLKEGKLPLDSLQKYTFQYTPLYKDMAYLAAYMRRQMNSQEGLSTPLAVFQKINGPILKMGNIDFTAFPQVQIQNRLMNLSSLFPDVKNNGCGLVGFQQTSLSVNHRLPYDFAIIYVGDETETIGDKELAVHNKSLQELIHWTEQFAWRNGLTTEVGRGVLPVKEVYNHFNNFLQMELFQKLITCLEHHNEEYFIWELIKVLQDMGTYHCLLEREYEMISRVYHAFAEQKTFPDEICACVPLTTVKLGGTFLVVVPRHQPKQTFDTLLQSLEKQYGYAPTMLYASRKEGVQDKGVHLTQYLSVGMYSSYISPGTIELQTGDGQRVVGEYESVKQHPLLLQGINFDLVKKKITINGEKVAHKAICSQTATIEIMLCLFNNIGRALSNTELPKSAYSKNKNEMISKIILPFQQLVHNHFGEQLDISCSGSLYDRNICLKSKPQCVHLLKRLQSDTYAFA